RSCELRRGQQTHKGIAPSPVNQPIELIHSPMPKDARFATVMTAKSRHIEREPPAAVEGTSGNRTSVPLSGEGIAGPQVIGEGGLIAPSVPAEDCTLFRPFCH